MMSCVSNSLKTDAILEKGTTPVCVSALCSVKSSGANIDPLISRRSISLSMMIQLLSMDCVLLLLSC